MQAVILAAGEGTRMHPLTLECPKPLIQVAGLPLLSHVVMALPEEITEIIIIVGYKAEQIKAYCGDTFYGRPVRYVEQIAGMKGTGAALKSAQPFLKGRFLVTSADDLMHPDGFRNALAHQYAVVAVWHDEPKHFGVLHLTDRGTLASIVEKPEQPESNLINTSTMVLDTSVFNYEISPAGNGELQLTDMVAVFAQEKEVVVARTPAWLSVGRPEDIAHAERVLLTSLELPSEPQNIEALEPEKAPFSAVSMAH